MVSSRIYDAMYRWWAPWDAVGVRDELRRLLETGEVTPESHPRAIDLGCGTGANVVELATRGFDATGVDFSPVALGKARERARRAAVPGERCRFLDVDLTAPALPPAVRGPYDLLLDFGTLDDLRPAGRARMAGHIARLARPGAVVLFYCFHGDRAELPRISFRGPSRMAPGLERGEEERLFGEHFEVEPFLRPHPHIASFLLRRRAARPASGRARAGRRSQRAEDRVEARPEVRAGRARIEHGLQLAAAGEVHVGACGHHRAGHATSLERLGERGDEPSSPGTDLGGELGVRAGVQE
jgi:SAM-dependent methyltransferase